MRRHHPTICGLVVLACGCAADAPGDATALPWMRTPFPAAVAPVDNPQSEAKTELGRLLFYDPLLSSDREVACATCHSELWGMGDGLPLSVGIDGVGAVGPGRTGPNVTTRNAGTLWNVALRASLFWDGRSDTLERQALVPLENAVEMNRDVDELVVDLRALPGYHALFSAAFDGAEPITADNVARALASFERTLISSRGPYDRYAAGDEGALKAEAVDGMFLFAEAGCSDCHVPPLFESERYAARGIGDASDIGREAVTGSAADRGAFRVPTLRNLRETGPYFHDGSVASLEQAVAHEVARSVAEGRSRALDESEVRAIATFIHKGLMDRSQEPDRPEEVPSGLDVPLDGFRIVR